MSGRCCSSVLLCWWRCCGFKSMSKPAFFLLTSSLDLSFPRRAILATLFLICFFCFKYSQISKGSSNNGEKSATRDLLITNGATNSVMPAWCVKAHTAVRLSHLCLVRGNYEEEQWQVNEVIFFFCQNTWKRRKFVLKVARFLICHFKKKKKD